MRDKFISSVPTIIEKEFWQQFFVEVDKRAFVEAEFKVKDFGLRINDKHLIEGTSSYSLMFTRNGLFVINNKGYNGEKYDGLNRLKHWCITPGLPEKFYSELNLKGLLSMVKKNSEIIDIPGLLKYRTPSQLIGELFQCIDLFS